MIHARFRTIPAVLLLLGAGASPGTADPEIFLDQVIGHGFPDHLVLLGDSIYFSTIGPDYGVARYDLVTGEGSPIDAPPFLFGTFPRKAASHVFFRGARLDDPDRIRLYRVAGTNAIELAVATDLGSASRIVDLNGLAIFAFSDEVHGTELWRSDGTVAGTGLLIDIHPTGSSSPTIGAVAGGVLFFTADDGVQGAELWKTDGTAAGTVPVKDIEPGPGGSNPYNFVQTGGQVAFSADDGTNGRELWRSDGTLAGTYMVADLAPGPSSSSPRSLAHVDSWLYFGAFVSGLGIEPFRTDGAVIELVADVNPGSSSSYPDYFSLYDGWVYFSADNGVNGDALWKTDPAATGADLFYDFDAGPDGRWIREFTEHNGAMFFVVSGDEPFDDELWRTEGDLIRTVMIPIRPDFGSRARGLLSIGSHLYLGADAGGNVGHELRRLIWDEDSVELLYDHNTEIGGNAEQLGAYGEDLLAFSDAYWDGRDLWFYDLSDPAASTSLDDPLNYFVDQTPVGAEYVVDGDHVFFSAFDPETGLEVALYDGTEVHLAEVNPGTDGSDPSDLVIAGGKAFFVARSGTSGNFGIYRLGGAPSYAISLVHDCGSSRPTGLTPLGGSVVFSVLDPDFGREPWITDGQDTALLLDIRPGTSGSTPQSFTAMGNHVFFTAVQPGTGRELWCTDGTSAGTHLVADLAPGAASSDPGQLTDGYPFLYLSATTPATGTELYRATAAGIEALPEIVPGAGDGGPEGLAFVTPRLYFSADDGSGIGREPWRTAGNGVEPIGDLRPGPDSSDPAAFGGHLGAVYFVADDGATGRELWRVTGGSFVNVSDPIVPGSGSSQIGDRASVGTELYFVAEDAEHGREIWFVTDGGGPSDVPAPPAMAGGVRDRIQLRVGPNPFSDRVALRFVLPTEGDVRLGVFDASGRVVLERSLGVMTAGEHELDWSLAPEGRSAEPWSKGIYFLRLQVGDRSATEKLVRLQ